jgi:flagella basal body P-ring formation protein FlgA
MPSVDRRLRHPLTRIAMIALLVFSARLLAAQQPAARTHRVAVAMRAIPRGAVLGDDDFVVRDTAVRTVSPLPDSTRVSAGWVTRRSIAAGELLIEPAVEAPSVVTANSSVQVEFQDQNVTLTIRGIAARSGAIGERVPVRTELGKRLDATVIAPGRVRID